MAARGARAAGGQAADHRVPGRGHACGREPMDRRFCAAAARTRLDRGSHRRDRVSLGRGTQRALRRDRGRVRPAQGRCHRHGGNRSSPRGKAGDIGHPDRVRGRRGTRLAPASSRVWRDRAATSPACRSRRPILLASELELLREVRPRSPPVGDHGQCRQSHRRAGDGRGSGSGPHARPRGRHDRNPASGGYRARLRGAQGPRGCTLCLYRPAC